MNDYIKSILDNLSINNYYLQRPTKIENCIVYTFNSYPRHYADGIETYAKYSFYFNLVVDSNIEKHLEEVKTLLKQYKFKKVVINSPYKLENGFFEITMNYTKNINESEDL